MLVNYSRCVLSTQRKTRREALSKLYRAISELLNNHPDGLYIIAGDFIHANDKSVLSKFYQHVDLL